MHKDASNIVTHTATCSTGDPLTVDEVLAGLNSLADCGFDLVKYSELNAENVFNEFFALRNGFDLNAGDLMFVGRDFDLTMVPGKYKDQVKTNRYGDRAEIVLMKAYRAFGLYIGR